MRKVLLLLVLFVSFSAMAQDSTAVDTLKITPSEIADIIELQVQPIIDVAVDEIRKAPVKGTIPQWISWAIGAFVSFFSVIAAIFFSGNKRDLTLN